ncbi:ATP-dependent helicase C-terminal domain-containing protein [Solwaraspora sp. WMMD1047]|uniref:ATP-dependent RNA helicase n=1 Tax=Solwaraspora sp. WMMD1047 TaxID=3016102 RepID=UPI002415CA05|nr:ATP-dependent helicase C-terminal domain-containing protein [Solwaraspora sp. WMMD1047]MDG4830169.1 ATP-dependent helicase C-terminal domain-containing protein [Solwaraspora sp. WMMD1047]
MSADLAADLPVRHLLPAIRDTLRRAGAAVLVAPPGSGKTTLVPPALLDDVAGKVVIAQPRRVAARAAAHRIAALLGERVGGTVGYAVRGERRSGPRTRVEVVTTGLLVRRLQADPELAGTDAVLLDECHERHLDSDLALAFCVEARAALRPDLRLLAMSATAEAERFAALLGPPGHPVPVLAAEGTPHPVEVVWAPPPRPLDAPHGLRVDPRLLDHVAATVRWALREATGDVLVFLPGAGEIAAVTGRLADLRFPTDPAKDGPVGRDRAGGPREPEGRVELVPLHGRQSGSAQDVALRAGARRRVVLATAVAESSLTVPGVRIVVDAGLSRVARTDLARGLGALVTVPVSRSSATQRAGRAGRQGPGRVYRCWSEATHDRLPEHPEPEIAVADLTGFALQLAVWGHPTGAGLALPDEPPPAALRIARETLAALGAVDADGRATGRGRSMAAVGAHPRLARALLDGAGPLGARRAAEVVALLAEDSLRGTAGGDDLAAGWRRLRSGADAAATARWRAEVDRLHAALPRPTGKQVTGKTTGPGRLDPTSSQSRRSTASQVSNPTSGQAGNPTSDPASGQAGRSAGLPDDLAAGLLVGFAYPERLARLREPGGTAYLMAGGTAADLPAGSALAGSPWLAIGVADRPAGRRSAVIRQAAVIDEATAREAGAALLRQEREVRWAGDDVVARDVRSLGAIVLSERALDQPDRDQLTAALLDGLRRVGLDLLRWSDGARSLRARLAFCRAALGDPWPDVGDEALLRTAGSWLGPELATARRRTDLGRIDVASALRRLLPWPAAARLDELAPERIAVPSGSRPRVDYADPAAPVLAVKLQETFGWRAAPRIGDARVPVLLHLLSPAGRPVAVTADLGSFWQTGYPQVRAELRGRYPRHPWPEDPTTAVATARAQPRRR